MLTVTLTLTLTLGGYMSYQVQPECHCGHITLTLTLTLGGAAGFTHSSEIFWQSVKGVKNAIDIPMGAHGVRVEVILRSRTGYNYGQGIMLGLD